MARGIRNTAVPQLPASVEWCTHVPVVVIPSAGHSKLDEGTEIETGPQGRKRRQEVARRTPTNSRRETEVRLRYQPCCERHMEEIEAEGIKALIGPAQLQAMANRLSQHTGHGALRPSAAHIEWEECKERALCHDCVVEQCEELGIRAWYGNKDDGRHQYSDEQLMEQIRGARAAAEKEGA